ncbi:MAG: helix-turn-helix transcriptional regulator [Actinomycetales bacterium]
MSTPATERLLNLVIALLGSRRGRSREYIRTAVAGYDSDASEEAFGRMFERDKVQLRRLGIPILSNEDPSGDGKNSWTYRIDPADYRLPEIPLDEQGAAVLALAARVWEQASLGSAAARALRKIATVAGTRSEAIPGAPESRIRTSEAAFDPLWEALLGRHPVTFAYRNAQTRDTAVRTVRPWGLGNKYGQWYLDGFDAGRGGQRLFRLSRISGDVTVHPEVFSAPEGYDIADALDRLGTGAVLEAVLDVIPGAAALIPGAAQTPGPADAGSGAADATATASARAAADAGSPEGRQRITVSYREPEMLAAELAALGPAVVVVAPADLRADVVHRLERTRDADLAPAVVPDFAAARAAAHDKETAEDRLRRLLDLVPFLVRNSGIAFDEVAREFAVSAGQLTRDLELLSVCGLPGYLHGDLIDVRWEDGPVWIRDAEVLQAPLRLTQAEAAALLVGLESLQSLPDAAARDTLDRVLDNVRQVAGPQAWIADVVEARISPAASLDTLSLLQRAAATGGLVRLDYFVRGRGELTTRTVEPRRVFGLDSVWYVEAWCRSAGGLRNFRLDNIRTASEVPGHAPDRGPAAGGFPASIFTPGDDDQVVTLALAPDAVWVADAYAAQRRALLADGRTAVTLRLARTTVVPALLARLGGSAQLLAPEQLRGTSARWATAALEGYPEAPGPTP